MTFAELYTSALIWLRDMEGEVNADRSLTRSMALLFFNEAIDEACRRARLITDSLTADICSIAVTAGTPSYALDSRIIKIGRVKLAGRDAPLERFSWRDLDRRHPGWEAQSGEVIGYLTDRSSGYLDLYRTPEADGSLSLAVFRTPLSPLEDDTDTPEIAPRYHAKLVPYVIARCRDIEDTELYDPRKAAKAMALFDGEFGPPRPAWCETFEESQPDYEGEW